MSPKKWIVQNPALTMALGILLFTLCYLFRTGFMDPSQTVWSSDYIMSLHRDIATAAKTLAPMQWNLTYFLGYISEKMVYVNWPLLAVFPVGVSMWLNIFLHFLLAGCGAWFCARQFGIGKWGAALAAIGFGLTPNIVSLMHAGHVYKIQSLPWIPWIFGFYFAAWQKGSWKGFIAAAMCYALAFQGGEPQVPFYAGLYLMALTLVLLIQDIRTKTPLRQITKKTGFAIGCALLTVLLSFQTLANFANFKSKNATAATALSDSKSAEELDKENYEFCTGWSFPPEDCSIFLMSHKVRGGITPAYFGRIGTAATTLRLNDEYMGIAICIFAIAGLVVGRKNKAFPFLVLLLATALLIGFGKYTPLYELIYKLPTMASQRAPARWIFFVAFSLNMLAALGFNHFIESFRNKNKRWYALPIGIGAVLAIVLIAAAALGVHSEDFAQAAFGSKGTIAATEDPAIMQLRAKNVLGAFRQTESLLFLFVLATALPIWLTRTGTAKGKTVAYSTFILTLAITATDLGINARDFIQFYQWKQYHAENDIIRFFKQDKDIYSIQPLGTQANPIINQTVGQIGTWHRLRFTEMQAMHRVRDEFATIYRELKTEKLPHQLNPRLYDLMNVKYLLSAYQLPPEVLTFAKLKPAKQFRFGQYPPIIIYEYTGFKPFAEFAAGAAHTESDQDALLAACREKDISGMVFSPDVESEKSSATGTVQLISHSYRGMEIKTSAETKGWLVLKTLLPKGLHAKVNGKSTPIIKSHGLYPAIALPPGQNTVAINASRYNKYQLVTLLSWLCILSVLVASHLKNRKQSEV